MIKTGRVVRLMERGTSPDDDPHMTDDGWRLGHRPGLDQMRGLAILLVVVQHCFPGGRVGWAGGIGVTMFFVLSGFLITRLLLEERQRRGRIDLKHFYVRRARRLLPALPAAFALCALVNGIHAGTSLAEPLLGSAFYVANYLSIGDPSWGAFQHMWSLSVEEHFYVLWPPLVVLLPRRALLSLGLVTVVVVAAARWIVALENASLAYRSTHLRIDALLVGALLAFVISRCPKPPLALAMLSGALIAVWLPTTNAEAAIRWGILPISVASTVVLVHALGWRRRSAILEGLGRISYGVYLIHVPVTGVLKTVGVAGWSLLFVGGSVSVYLAWLSYRYIEEPFRSRGPALSRRVRRDDAIVGVVTP